MSSRRSRTLALGVTGFIVTLSFSGCGQTTGTDTADESTASATVTTSTTPTPSATMEPPPGLSEEDWLGAALTATRAGVPAFVPAEQPQGYAVTLASFETDASTWHMEFTDGAGETVALVEARKPAATLIAEQVGPGAVPGDDVDLSAYGTGTWSSWTAADRTVLSLQVKKTAVVLDGPSLEAVTAVAQTLLTADTASPDSAGE